MAEMMVTGASPETATLAMLYVRQEYRRRGIARALLGSCAGILRERGTAQMITHIHSRNEPQVGLMRSLGGVRRRIVTILPAIEIT